MKNLPVLLLIACAAPERQENATAQSGAAQVQMLFQSRVDGEIEPCG